MTWAPHERVVEVVESLGHAINSYKELNCNPLMPPLERELKSMKKINRGEIKIVIKEFKYFQKDPSMEKARIYTVNIFGDPNEPVKSYDPKISLRDIEKIKEAGEEAAKLLNQDQDLTYAKVLTKTYPEKYQLFLGN